jgi:hypothetical protein
MKRKEFNGTPRFYSLPQGERRERRKKFKRPPHPCPLLLMERADKGIRI